MIITFHFCLLSLVIFAPLVPILTKSAPCRVSLKLAIFSLFPFLVIGVCSFLLLQLGGRPTVEWLLPGLSAFLTGLVAKKPAMFFIVKRGLIIVSIILCFNFICLVNFGEYTANRKETSIILNTLQKTLLLKAEKELGNAFQNLETIPKGYISDLLSDDHFNHGFLWSFQEEWHSCLTRLVYIKKEAAAVWHSGDGKLELKLKEKKSTRELDDQENTAWFENGVFRVAGTEGERPWSC